MKTIYDILSSMPYEKIVGDQGKTENPSQEVFEIHCLGIFKGPGVSLIQSKDLDALEIVELVLLKPKTLYRPHYHKKSTAIIYIIWGRGVFLQDDQKEPYDKEHRFVIPAGLKHGFQTTTETLFLSIQTPPILNRETEELDLYYD